MVFSPFLHPEELFNIQCVYLGVPVFPALCLQYETVVQHLWRDSPTTASEGTPVTVFHLTAKNRVVQPKAPTPPALLKPCLAQRGRPSGHSTASSVSYIFPGGSRTDSDASSNQSRRVSSHSYESLDHQGKPVMANGRPKRQVRIVAPEDKQGSDSNEAPCKSIKVSYDDIVGPCADMKAFDDVIDEEDRYELVKEGSVNADDGHRAANKLGTKTTYRTIPRDAIQ